MMLEGRRILVTGTTSGIGLGVAASLVSRGARVCGVARRPTSVSGVLSVEADLSDEADARRAVREAAASLGGIDGLVHAAGIWEPGPIGAVDTTHVGRMFAVNTFSAFWLISELSRLPGNCAVVLIGSTAGQRGEPKHAAYAASKAALWGLVQSVAQELAPRIRVNLVSPGWVRTPMVDEHLDAATEARIVAGIPNRRLGTLDDCAAACAWLLSHESSHLVGIDLPLSGGSLLPVKAR